MTTRTVHPVYEETRHLVGQPLAGVRLMTAEEVGPDHAEVGPMYRATLPDGAELDLWPEEIEPPPIPVSDGHGWHAAVPLDHEPDELASDLERFAPNEDQLYDRAEP